MLTRNHSTSIITVSNMIVKIGSRLLISRWREFLWKERASNYGQTWKLIFRPAFINIVFNRVVVVSSWRGDCDAIWWRWDGIVVHPLFTNTFLTLLCRLPASLATGWNVAIDGRTTNSSLYRPFHRIINYKSVLALKICCQYIWNSCWNKL